MTDKQRMYCLSEAANYTDRDTYVSDLAPSPIWGDSEYADIPSDRIESLRTLYTAYHRSVRDICAASGLSHRAVAERFCIPYRTMENWCGRVNTPPDYVRLMMQECLGLLDRPGEGGGDPHGKAAPR